MVVNFRHLATFFVINVRNQELLKNQAVLIVAQNSHERQREMVTLLMINVSSEEVLKARISGTIIIGVYFFLIFFLIYILCSIRRGRNS